MEANKKKKIIEKAISAAKKNKCLTIEELTSYLPISRSTFYSEEMDKLDTIKEVLENNKISIKASMRKKWFKSKSSLLQVCLYKLIGTEEEAHRLNGSKQNITGEMKLNVILKAPKGIKSNDLN